MNSAVFGKTIENTTKYLHIMLVTTDKIVKYLFLVSNYHSNKWFSADLIAIELKNRKLKYISLILTFF